MLELLGYRDSAKSEEPETQEKPLKPYQARHSPCPFCGNDATHRVFICVGVEGVEGNEDKEIQIFECAHQVEHVHRTCEACQGDWAHGTYENRRSVTSKIPSALVIIASLITVVTAIHLVIH